MQIEHVENPDESVDIIIKLSAQDVKCLKHDLPGIQGILDWYSKGPSFEKIYRCKERMCKEQVPILRARGLSIPAKDEDLLKLILENPQYKDRESREKDAAR